MHRYTFQWLNLVHFLWVYLSEWGLPYLLCPISGVHGFSRCGYHSSARVYRITHLPCLSWWVTVKSVMLCWWLNFCLLASHWRFVLIILKMVERLDHDTSAIQITYCDHSFQCPCISKWAYLSCQVGSILRFVFFVLFTVILYMNFLYAYW